jgi:hypothetical protein
MLCGLHLEPGIPTAEHDLLRRAAKEMAARSASGQEVEKRVGLGDPHAAQHIGATRQLFLV